MGGVGSGSWYRWSKKSTVEECLQLSTVSLRQYGILRPNAQRLGFWAWSNSVTKQEVAKIGYDVFTGDMEQPFIRLFYSYRRGLEQNERLFDYAVGLTTTRPNYGGLRWWFICPGSTCQRRVGRLYLVGGVFLCRRCHDLTYQSCQASDARVARLRDNPDELLAAMRSNETKQLLLALKAMR